MSVPYHTNLAERRQKPTSMLKETQAALTLSAVTGVACITTTRKQTSTMTRKQTSTMLLHKLTQGQGCRMERMLALEQPKVHPADKQSETSHDKSMTPG